MPVGGILRDTFCTFYFPRRVVWSCWNGVFCYGLFCFLEFVNITLRQRQSERNRIRQGKDFPLFNEITNKYSRLSVIKTYLPPPLASQMYDCSFDHKFLLLLTTYSLLFSFVWSIINETPIRQEQEIIDLTKVRFFSLFKTVNTKYNRPTGINRIYCRSHRTIEVLFTHSFFFQS